MIIKFWTNIVLLIFNIYFVKRRKFLFFLLVIQVVVNES